MAFPQTRHTLIQRLAICGSDIDWQDFFHDYWVPICRFAMRRGNVRWHEAEEIASLVFEVVLKKDLIQRWHETPKAKLRTLLCAVTCRVQANYVRSASRRDLSLATLDFDVRELSVDDTNWEKTFYAAWVDDLLQKCLNSLVREYHAQDRGDYVRVLYGRLNEGLTIAQVSQTLDLSASSVDNYYRHAIKRLKDSIRSAVQSHVIRYTGDAQEGFAEEWAALAEHLRQHGGLAQAVRNAEVQLRSCESTIRRQMGVQAVLQNSGIVPTPS